MEDQLNGAAPVVTEATPVVENTSSPAPVSSIEDTMSSVWDKMNPERDASGKFAGTDTQTADTPETPEGVEAKEPTDQPEDQVQEPSQTAITAPNSWSAEMKAKWASLPPETQQYIAARESEMHTAITQKGEQIKAFEPIRQTLDQHRAVFAKNGVSEAEGLSKLFAADRFLEQNPSEAIKWLADSYGIDLRQFAGNQNSDDQSPAPSRDVLELKQELRQLKSILTDQQRAQHNAEQATVAQTVEEFAKDKPHFEKVRKIMGSLMQAGEATDLQDAYDKAVYAHPEIRQSILADQLKADEAKRKAEQEKAASAAKKAGSLNLKSSEGKSPVKSSSMEETMSAVFDRLHGNG